MVEETKSVEQPKVRGVVKKKKIAPALFNPKQLLALPAEVRTLVLGRVIGIAERVTEVVMPNDEVFEGLGGTFKFVPADANLDIVVAHTLYFPGGFAEDFFDAVGGTTNPETGEVTPGRPLEIAFEIGVSRSSSPAGYEWLMKPLLERATTFDPIAALEAKLNGGVAALSAPNAAPALPAPNAAPAPDAAATQEPEKAATNNRRGK